MRGGDQPAGLAGEPPARMVIAVRGDYWDRCAAYPQLVRAMEQDQLVVGPMREASLRRAITGQAEASGLRVDSALIDAIVADVHAADAGPGGAVLPLLSQALALTWENREGDRLGREGYDRAGRVARSVEVSAEDVYTGLPEGQQAVARDMFRRMTAVDPDRRPVRRPASRAELCTGRPKNQRAEVGAVLDAFARNRLLVLGTDSAEIAHDVVLQAWPRLRDWLEEDQASLILYGQLAEDAARWRQNGKDSSLLYRGVQLAATQEATRVWAADPGRYPALTTGEADFLRASGRAATREPVGAPDAGRSPGPAAPRRARRSGSARSGRPGTAPVSSAPRTYRNGWPRRAWRSRPSIRSPLRCSPGPPGGSRRPRRRGTACSSRSPSRCAASWPPSRAW